MFYNPVLSLLLDKSNDTSSAIAGPSARVQPLMRTLTEIRKAELIPQVVNKDSVYKPIVRQPRAFKALKLSSKLQESLPFASKPKQMSAVNPKSYISRRAVVSEPEERANRAVVQMLSTIKKSKLEIRDAAQTARSKEKRAKKEREASRFEDIHKHEKKRKYREEGKEAARRLKKMQG
jgi:ribosome biogenesis protein BMS1